MHNEANEKEIRKQRTPEGQKSFGSSRAKVFWRCSCSGFFQKNQNSFVWIGSRGSRRTKGAADNAGAKRRR